MDAIFVLHSQKTIESMTLSQNDTSVTIIDKICPEKFGFCTIQVLYFEVLTDDNPIGRNLELPKDDKVASSGFLFLKVLAVLISQNIFYTPQIQVHPRICQTIMDFA